MTDDPDTAKTASHDAETGTLQAWVTPRLTVSAVEKAEAAANTGPDFGVFS